MQAETSLRRGQVALGEVAYVLKGFPRLTETFIANEIHLLEQMGLRLRLYSIKEGERTRVQGVVAKIRAPLTQLPHAGSISERSIAAWLVAHFGRFAQAHGRVLASHPLRYAGALAQALAMSWRYRKSALTPRRVFIKEFVQAGAIAAALLDTPSVRHLHGHFCHGATTVTWLVSRLTGLPFSFTAHAKDIYQARQNPGDLLARKMQAARFVATCTAANERHLRSVCPDCATVHTIYHGLDLRRFARAVRADALDEPPLILAVGRLVEKKGFDILIEACAQLARSRERFRCVIIGEHGEMSQRLRDAIERHGLGDLVTLHGAVTQDELVNWYERAAVFALPCQVTDDGDRDGIPNVLAEAMATGLAVVSTPISGIPELVDDGVDGLLVPDREADLLAQALRRLITDRALRDRLGDAASRKVHGRFDARLTTRTLYQLFVRNLASAPEPVADAVPEHVR